MRRRAHRTVAGIEPCGRFHGRAQRRAL